MYLKVSGSVDDGADVGGKAKATRCSAPKGKVLHELKAPMTAVLRHRHSDMRQGSQARLRE